MAFGDKQRAQDPWATQIGYGNKLCTHKEEKGERGKTKKKE